MKPGNTLPIALSGPQRPVGDPRLARSSRPAWCSGPAGARVVPQGSAGPYPQVDSRRAAGRAGFGASGPGGAGVARRGQRGTTPWSLRPGGRRRERQRGPAGERTSGACRLSVLPAGSLRRRSSIANRALGKMCKSPQTGTRGQGVSVRNVDPPRPRALLCPTCLIDDR
jgi:hypothetical protein